MKMVIKLFNLFYMNKGYQVEMILRIIETFPYQFVNSLDIVMSDP